MRDFINLSTAPTPEGLKAVADLVLGILASDHSETTVRLALNVVAASLKPGDCKSDNMAIIGNRVATALPPEVQGALDDMRNMLSAMQSGKPVAAAPEPPPAKAAVASDRVRKGWETRRRKAAAAKRKAARNG